MLTADFGDLPSLSESDGGLWVTQNPFERQWKGLCKSNKSNSTFTEMRPNHNFKLQQIYPLSLLKWKRWVQIMKTQITELKNETIVVNGIVAFVRNGKSNQTCARIETGRVSVMFIDFTDEQKALRKELQAYYTNLITPEIHELQKLEEGTGPVRRKAC